MVAYFLHFISMRLYKELPTFSSMRRRFPSHKTHTYPQLVNPRVYRQIHTMHVLQVCNSWFHLLPLITFNGSGLHRKTSRGD